MNWFQRYGFPGMYFWGLLILWLTAFHACEIKGGNVKMGNCTVVDVKIIGAIIAASFLPVGYLISILGQSLYLLSPFGVHLRATRKADIRFGDNDACRGLWGRWEPRIEALSCFAAASHPGCATIDESRYLQGWVRNRTNVLAIDFSLMLSTVLSPFTAYAIVKVFGLDTHPNWNWNWLWFAFLLSVFIFVVSLGNWLILCHQVTILITAHLRLLFGERFYQGEMRGGPNEPGWADLWACVGRLVILLLVGVALLSLLYFSSFLAPVHGP